MLIGIFRNPFGKVCTPGLCTVDGDYFSRSLERPWLDNAPRRSCVPEGLYDLAITPSFKFKRPMLEVLGVPGRSGIRVHNVNHWSQLRGCLALAEDAPTPETLRNGMSTQLQLMVQKALRNKERVQIQFINPEVAT